MATISDTRVPSRIELFREGLSLAARLYKAFGRLGERGPAAGEKAMIIPGFLADDRTTLGLQRGLAEAGYRVTGWGLGLNRGVRADTVERIVERLERFAGGGKVMLIGWSLGGLFAREAAKACPQLVSRVVTMGSPFSGDRRGNNVWQLYEWVAGHPVDRPPIETAIEEKPPVPTLALWSRRDGIVAVACARGEPHESDRQVELDCGHMAFALSNRAYPQIISAIRTFERETA
ncbi:MAG: esterase/lipase family protein [Sphingosinicella sp.]